MSLNKILFEDCTVAADRVLTELDRPVNCILTDPPYGMDVAMNSSVTPEGKKRNERIHNDADLDKAIGIFYSAMFGVIPHLADEADIYIFTAWHVLDAWLPAVKELDDNLELKMMLLWEKGYPGKGDLTANWGCGHEVILYMKKGRRPIPHRRSGILHYPMEGALDQAIEEARLYLELLERIKEEGRPLPTDIGFIAVDKLGSGLNIHPTEKPVPLLKVLLEMSTEPGDLVVDLFSGSGSTSVACKELGRDSIAFETDERFIEPSRARLEKGMLF